MCFFMVMLQATCFSAISLFILYVDGNCPKSIVSGLVFEYIPWHEIFVPLKCIKDMQLRRTLRGRMTNKLAWRDG